MEYLKLTAVGTLMLMLLFTSCSHKKKEINYGSEIKAVLPDTISKYFQPDSVRIEVFNNNICKLGYTFKYSGINLDSSSSSQFIYLPFVISHEPIRLLSDPKIDTSGTDLLDITSNSGIHYYLIAIANFKIQDSGTIRFDYLLHLNDEEAAQLKLPFVYKDGTSHLIVKTNWDTKLANSNITSNLPNEYITLEEYPREIQSIKRTYSAIYNFKEGDVIKIDTQITHPPVTLPWNKILWSACLIIIIFIIFFYRDRWLILSELPFLEKRLQNLKERFSYNTKSTSDSYYSDQGKEILELEREYRKMKRSQLRASFIIMIIITLLFTLFASIVSAQQKFAIQNMKIELRPLFISSDSLDMNIKLRYLLISAKPKKIDQTISFYINCDNCNINEDEIVTVPAGLKKELVPQNRGYEIRLFAKNDNPVEPSLFNYIINHQSGYAEAEDATKLNFGKDYSELRICAHQFDFIDTSKNVNRFLFVKPGAINNYPWDKIHFNCNILIDKTTVIKNVKIREPENYMIDSANFYSNDKIVAFNDDSTEFEVRSNAGNYIKPGQATSTHITLKRGFFQKWIWWPLFIILCLFAPIYLVTPKKNLFKFIVVIFALIGVNYEYLLGLISKQYSLSFTYFLKFNHLSWGKIFFWFGVLLLLISIMFNFRRAQDATE